MKKRLPTAIILILILTPLFVFKDLLYLFQIIFGFFACFAHYELINILDQKYHFALWKKIFFSLITAVLFCLLAYSSLLHLLVFASIIMALMGYVLVQSNYSINEKRLLFLSFLYPAFGFGTITYIRRFGVQYLLLLVAICALTDTYAYFTGLSIGKHKMAPRISPKKSWEGAIGGTIMAALIVIPYFYFYQTIIPSKVLEYLDIKGSIFLWDRLATLPPIWGILVFVGMVILLSIAGQIGDLYASQIKRTFKIKDYSQIFPGHGGVLDRFDSLVFVSGITYLMHIGFLI